MHISDGILNAPVWIGGYAATAALTAATLYKVDMEEIPKISVLTAVFFVADLIHVPMGPASVHLILNGLLGVILGWRAFPAVLLGVTLQTILLGHGGLTVIGVNTLDLGGGALVGFLVWQLRHLMPGLKNREMVFGALAGAFAVASSGMIMASALLFTGKEFLFQAKMVLVAHAIIMVLEATVVGFAASYLARVRPDALAGQRKRPVDLRGVTPLLVALLIGAALLAPVPAHAHKLLVDYTPRKEGVLFEAFFPDGKPAQQIGVRLLTPQGEVIASGTTNVHGGYLFSIPAAGDYAADADAQMGHFARLDIPASALEGVVEYGAAPVDEEALGAVKVHREAFPLARVVVGFGILALLGGGSWLLSRRRKQGAA
ncbi:MAG: cobalt transporter CbiM [Nitrospirota bacterium]|nr:cobalt transporter CbiM [Nitrospirota bacterium]